MADKLGYKKEYKTLYMPGRKPVLIDIPAMNFIMIDGDPRHEEYQNAITALYALSFTIKMNKTGNNQPKEYFKYVVSPTGKLMVDGRRCLRPHRERRTEVDIHDLPACCKNMI